MIGKHIYRGDPAVCRTCRQTGQGNTVRGFGGRQVVPPCPACKGVRVQAVPYVDLYGSPIGEIWRTMFGTYSVCIRHPHFEPTPPLGLFADAEKSLLESAGGTRTLAGPPPDGTGSLPPRHRELADRRAQMEEAGAEEDRRLWLLRSFCADKEVTFLGDICWGTAEEADAFRKAVRGFRGTNLDGCIDRWLVVPATRKQVARFYPVIETIDDPDWISFVSSRYVPLETVRKNVLEERQATRGFENALARALGVSDPLAGLDMVGRSILHGNRRSSDASANAPTASNGR